MGIEAQSPVPPPFLVWSSSGGRVFGGEHGHQRIDADLTLPHERGRCAPRRRLRRGLDQYHPFRLNIWPADRGFGRRAAGRRHIEMPTRRAECLLCSSVCLQIDRAQTFIRTQHRRPGTDGRRPRLALYGHRGTDRVAEDTHHPPCPGGRVI